MKKNYVMLIVLCVGIKYRYSTNSSWALMCKKCPFDMRHKYLTEETCHTAFYMLFRKKPPRCADSLMRY